MQKDLYRKICQLDSSIPIFSRPWWLDVVTNGDWDVCLVIEEGQILASMPIYIKKRFGFSLATLPPLTHNLGPWFYKPSANIPNKLAGERELLNQLIGQIPKVDYFSQNWHCSRQNWLPFYWNGFNQTTRYTYRLQNLKDLDAVWRGFKNNIRSDIRKAANRYNLKVRTDLNVDDFLKLHKQVFSRQGLPAPYSDDLIRSLDAACRKNFASKIFIAEDQRGDQHAGVYIIWDHQSAYYLMGGGDPILRSSGATSLCLWEAIKFSANLVNVFDFEGSMIEPIERYFRAFGTTQTPYFNIAKSNSWPISLAKYLRGT